MIQVVHKSRKYSPKLNFPATENVLSWSFVQEGDGFIYQNPLTTGDSTNVATLTIDGLNPTYPFTLTNGSSYQIAITKTTNGQTASVTLRTRRQNDKVNEINVPDFGDLAINGNYVLLTNVGNNGQVVAFDKSQLNIGNYAGAGVWTNSIVRGVVNLPDIATPYGSPVFSWTVLTHVKFNGNDYVLAIGHATASNNNRGRVVCLINPTTLAVTNLDGTANSYTYITNTGTSDSSEQQQESYICENFIENKIILGYSSSITELDINNSIWATRPGYPFGNIDLGLTSAGKTQCYYNPIDYLIPAQCGQFNKLRAQHYTVNGSMGSYDYLRNVKLTFYNAWGRLKGYDKNGLLTWQIDNSSLKIVLDKRRRTISL